MRLRGENHPIPPPPILQRASDDPLAFAARVTVARVDQVDPGVDGAMNDADRFGLGRGVGEVVAPQAERRNADARPAEQSIFHASLAYRAVYPASTTTIEPVM
jgi:hypothetical protein